MNKKVYSKITNYFIKHPICSENDLMNWANSNLTKDEIQDVKDIYSYLQNEGIIYYNGEYIIKRGQY